MGESEQALKRDEPGPDEVRKARDADTEGHRKYADDGEEIGPDGVRRKILRGDEGDVEGHRK